MQTEQTNRLAFRYRQEGMMTNRQPIRMGIKNSTGFTLIELLVVIVIIAILAGIILPVMMTARKRATAAVCVSNLHQLYSAFAMYAQDNSGRIPPFQTHFGNAYPPAGNYSVPDTGDQLEAVLSPYIKDSQIWFCPSDPYAHTNSKLGDIDHQYTSYFSSEIMDYIPTSKGLIPFALRPVPIDVSWSYPTLHIGFQNRDPSTIAMLTDSETWGAPYGSHSGTNGLPLYTHGDTYVTVFFDGHVKIRHY
jgi:prepilin-type N-terminal cleavage/methylation domain-containing protein